MQKVAEEMRDKYAQPYGLPFEIIRKSPLCLLVNIGGCETVGFDFKTMAEQQGKDANRWNPFEDLMWFEAQHTGAHYEKYPDQQLVWAFDFCKTQFAKNIIEHKFVADLVRVIASRCMLSKVYDEGDYYHSGNLEDASEAIHENGLIIGSVGKMLGGQGYEVIAGGATKIKPVRLKVKNERDCLRCEETFEVTGNEEYCPKHAKNMNAV